LRSANNRTRSGGRQPAVVPKNAPATGSDFRELITFATHDGPVYHGGLTPPALGCACGRTVTRAALRYRDASPHSHGWLTPAAPGARCRSGEEITTFAVHKRTFYRIGGRQPAVVWQTHLQDDSICVRRITARRAAGVSPPWVTTCQQRRYGTRSDTVIAPDQERWSPVLRVLRNTVTMIPHLRGRGGTVAVDVAGNTVTMIPHLPAVRCRRGKLSHHAEVGPGVVRTVRGKIFGKLGLT
jgi:hypothetical protein